MTDPTWHGACPLADLPRDDVRGVSINGIELAIVRTNEDRLHVIDAVCTHGRALLTDGLVDGMEIECPKHNGRFNVETGQAVASPARAALRTYPCRVVDGLVEVQF